ncbi:mannitol-1-phosphate 5-dehydrogenase [Marinococcus halophilus]|uniref:mannitol-1-phosphate 5-dehydrogenase n=1 Tax=Marinococcus halophilus TaxID=1371 RepID=UPI0009A8AF66|nr:mannitol-1-phosphate 5-dehydrogenase [Marinococcus halophilus]
MIAVQIGAGNIGRGFIGQVLSDAGYELYFADVNDSLIEQLKDKGEYVVELAEDGASAQTISGVQAFHSAREEEALVQKLAEADLITTAVGPSVLKHVAPVIAKALKQKIADGSPAPVNVIACENMVAGTAELKKFVWEQLSEEEKTEVDRFAGFANAAVDRIVPNQPEGQGLKVVVEPFLEWAVEAPSLKGKTPDIPAVTYVEDLTPYIERKLFTVNTGHAALAYVGFLYGCETTKEAMDHPEVSGAFESAIRETGRLLQIKHGFKEKEQNEYQAKIKGRFSNEYLSDPVTRVGRGPIRKLGPKDRLVRPAVELQEAGERPEALAFVIAAALQFNVPEDGEAVELQNTIDRKGYKEALSHYAELPVHHPLVELVAGHLPAE